MSNIKDLTKEAREVISLGRTAVGANNVEEIADRVYVFYNSVADYIKSHSSDAVYAVPDIYNYCGQLITAVAKLDSGILDEAAKISDLVQYELEEEEIQEIPTTYATELEALE